MLIKFDQNFQKDLKKIKEKKLFEKIKQVIDKCEEATSLKDVRNVRKIIGFRNYYRNKLGQYRIGIELDNPKTIRFVTILHRKEISMKFQFLVLIGTPFSFLKCLHLKNYLH